MQSRAEAAGGLTPAKDNSEIPFQISVAKSRFVKPRVKIPKGSNPPVDG